MKTDEGSLLEQGVALRGWESGKRGRQIPAGKRMRDRSGERKSGEEECALMPLLWLPED